MLEIENFQYKIGRQKSPVFNLKIPVGSINLILGDNGEGKTLFFKSLTGANQTLSGHFLWNDVEKDIFSLPIGYAGVSEYSNYDLRVNEYINYIEYLFDLSSDDINGLMEVWCMKEHLNTKVSNLSDGERKRLAIIETELINQPILLFDEPEANLDKRFRSMWMKYLRRNLSKKIFFIITHFPDLYNNFNRNLFTLDEKKVVEKQFFDACQFNGDQFCL